MTLATFVCIFVCIVEIVCPSLNLSVKQSDPISLARAHKQNGLFSDYTRGPLNIVCATLTANWEVYTSGTVFLIELPAKIVCKSPCCVRDSLWLCWQVTEE